MLIAKQEAAFWIIEAVRKTFRVPHTIEPLVNLYVLLFIQAMAAGMVTSKAQWLFLLTDKGGEPDPSVFLSNYEDGQNLAFLFNTSTAEEREKQRPDSQENNINCMISSILEIYVEALHQVIRTEETRYYQTTETDWARNKPSPGDRSNEVFRTFQVAFCYWFTIFLIYDLSPSPPMKL